MVKVSPWLGEVAQTENARRKAMMSRILTSLATRETARIVDIQRDAEGHWRKLMALGIAPGRIITVIQRFPTFVVEVGHTHAAIDRQMAGLILVE